MRPWLKTASWLVAIAALSAVAVAVVIGQTGRPSAMPYGVFLDQLEAGNVASVAFEGTQIQGVLKRPAEAFISHVPDFGDPALVPELRKRHVAIDVKMPSPWAWLAARIPWPMLLFVGAMIVAGLVRMLRGKAPRAGANGSVLRTRGMAGLVSTLMTKRQDAGERPRGGDDAPGDS